jgi:hypothetical protein
VPSGREAFAERSIYLILLTARTGAENLVEGFTAGADDYVTKPFRTEELRARVDVGFRVASLQRSVSERLIAVEVAERRYRELVEDLDVVVWEAELEPCAIGSSAARPRRCSGRPPRRRWWRIRTRGCHAWSPRIGPPSSRSVAS